MEAASEILDFSDIAMFEGWTHVSHDLCSCDVCDQARKSQVAAVAYRLIGEALYQDVIETAVAPCEQSRIQTVRPPRRTKAA